MNTLVTQKEIDINLKPGKSFIRLKKGPLSASRLCHNRSEHLPRIDFQIIIALVNN